MKHIVWGLVVLLIVAHQDFWYWDDATLICGLFPIGLFYHIVLSLVTAGVWFLATVYCWPEHLDDEAIPAGQAAGNDDGRNGG